MTSSATLVRRFLEFHGAGLKIATMAANILAREFHIPLRPEAVIYAARSLYPDCPGVFDLALWEVGRTACRPSHPVCTACRLRELCPYPSSQAGTRAVT